GTSSEISMLATTRAAGPLSTVVCEPPPEGVEAAGGAVIAASRGTPLAGETATGVGLAAMPSVDAGGAIGVPAGVAGAEVATDCAGVAGAGAVVAAGAACCAGTDAGVVLASAAAAAAETSLGW